MESNLSLRKVSAVVARQSAIIGVFVALLLANSLTPLAARAQTNISEFQILSTPFAEPFGITYGPDGKFWFTELYSSRVGSLDTVSNAIQDYVITNVGADPFGIVSAPDSNLWITIYASNQLARFSPITTNYVAYTLPSTNSGPSKLIVGPGNNLWFVEFNRNKIASISTPPIVNIVGSNMLVLNHEYGPFGTNSQIYGLTTGPDGNLWFTETSFGVIGNVNPTTGVSNIFVITTDTNCGPYAITTGPDGALWFTEYGTNRVGRITTNGIITEFNLPTLAAYPFPKPLDIITGLDGNLWFTEYNGSAVGKVTTNGIVTLYPTPAAPSFPTYMTAAPSSSGNSNIYFCEFVDGPPAGQAFANIARLNIAEALDLSVTNILSFQPGTTVVSNTAVFKNSRLINNITINWGDNTGPSTFSINNLTNAGATQTNVTLDLTVTCVVPIDTNFDVGTFNLSFTHTYAKRSNYTNIITITDNVNNTSVATLSLPDPFFNGQVISTNNGSTNIYYLNFPDGNAFGFYNYIYFPYLYHYALGFEYFIDANDASNGAYWYDFTSQHFWYTSPSLYPYIYDFSLNAWLYYFPGTPSSREFYDFNTATFIFE